MQALIWLWLRSHSFTAIVPATRFNDMILEDRAADTDSGPVKQPVHLVEDCQRWGERGLNLLTIWYIEKEMIKLYICFLVEYYIFLAVTDLLVKMAAHEYKYKIMGLYLPI